MKVRIEDQVVRAKSSLHLLTVDGRTEIHRIPAGNDLKDHEPRACPCGPKVDFRNTVAGPTWAHDHRLLGSIPEAFVK